MKSLFFLFLFPFSASCLAQVELLPNGNFENYSSLPDNVSEINRCKNWTDIYGSADFCVIYHPKGPLDPYYAAYIQKPLKQPVSGNACAALAFIGKAELPCGEIMETELNSTLVKDKEYVISVYCIFDQTYSTISCDRLRITFSDKTFNTDPCTSTLGPFKKERYESASSTYLFKNDKSSITDTSWVKISCNYTAKGGERFLAVGNYLKSDIRIEKNKYNDIAPLKYTQSYYSIDMISVKEKYLFKITSEAQLLNVYFNTGKSILLPSSDDALNSLFDLLKKNPSLKIEVSGHTDNSGSEAENKKLSEARAKSVADRLIKLGIESKRLSAAGFGSAKPIAENTSEKGKQQNRRVEFRIIK